MQVINVTITFPEMRFIAGDWPLGTDPDAVFPRTSPGVGPGITPDIDVVEFDTAPSQVTAILTGFRAWFQDDDDREFGRLDVRVGEPVQLSDTRFRIPVTFGLRDWSGDWDDEHGAEVHVAVIGD